MRTAQFSDEAEAVSTDGKIEKKQQHGAAQCTNCPDATRKRGIGKTGSIVIMKQGGCGLRQGNTHPKRNVYQEQRADKRKQSTAV